MNILVRCVKKRQAREAFAKFLSLITPMPTQEGRKQMLAWVDVAHAALMEVCVFDAGDPRKGRLEEVMWMAMAKIAEMDTAARSVQLPSTPFDDTHVAFTPVLPSTASAA
jgi:hypothetical protein